jgi:hypothetical protein
LTFQFIYYFPCYTLNTGNILVGIYAILNYHYINQICSGYASPITSSSVIRFSVPRSVY